ncbi:MAG TPA: acetylxylan esterase, partial [Terrimicrobiaceae bacterium]|nr:acetylxylan esterase [Terrimicrobiaceae bacterium]
MPCVDKPLHELREYYGISPKPGDFDAFWAAALAEVEATDPAPVLEPSADIHPRNSEAFDLWFTGVGGARIYAKYLRPKHAPRPHPAVLMFHGYTGNSGEWLDKLAYAGEGIAVAALDCRGQGGRSEDNTPVRGNTHHGHFLRG